MASRPHITRLLREWGDGDETALDELLRLVEKELREIASRYMRAEQQGHTLQTTALINEAYFKLIRQRRVRWANRSQFFGVAAILMRRILFDHAKERGRAKRGGSMQRVSLSEVSPVFKEGAGEFIELHEALNRLEELDERKALVVSLRYFGGLSIKEIAEMLHVAPSTVSKDWEFARAWLRAEMSHEE